MKPSQQPATRPSRRERPAKAALSRRAIIDAALAITREEGLERVTMRRIATTLDTGASALYVYVRDTEDLHAQILDELLATVTDGGEGRRAWRTRLKALLTSYARVLFEHPDLARMAMSTQPSGPHYLALCDAILGLLQKGRVADRDAAWGLDLLLLYPTALAAERGRRANEPAEDQLSALSAAIATADAARYPHVARLGLVLLSGRGQRFEWALDVLLDGIVHGSRGKERA